MKYYYKPWKQVDVWEINFYQDMSEEPTYTVWVRADGQREAQNKGEKLAYALNYNPDMLDVHYGHISQHDYDNNFAMHRINNICYFTRE